eukprot:TRINITY_DN1418_c0_g1_i2.p2 TRINITY_DN1418_c0_g1~~TRINITY_DN1418_c0_g1_i2.p2  ORF type:complete len:184 (-),score=3.78 TRINITY_DN1418_c0_g1_i2:148-645(-)
MQVISQRCQVFKGLGPQWNRLPNPRTIRISSVCRKSCLDVSNKQQSRTQIRKMKHKRLRGSIEGTPERPRLAVHKSGQHLYAQIVDDSVGNTLVFVTTLQKDVQSEIGEAKSYANIPSAQVVGRKIAEKCLELNIEKVCFDRGGHMYHGKIKAIADAAREAGLQF